MNLHGLASSATGSVNPPTTATIKSSIGSTTDAAGKPSPIYSTATGLIQVHALSAKELEHLNSLNITGVLHKVYATGRINSVMRASGLGGDIFNFDGFDWLVVRVFESWPEWSAVAVSQQVAP